MNLPTWHRPYCADTYLDALQMTAERRHAEIRGILDFLRTGYDQNANTDWGPLFLDLAAYHVANSVKGT